MDSPMTLSNLTLSDLERSNSMSLRFGVVMKLFVREVALARTSVHYIYTNST